MINFKEAKTKEDIIKICGSEVLNLESVCNPTIIESGFISYKNLDKEKEQKLLSLAKLTDKTYRNKDKKVSDGHKINSIMASIIILDKFNDNVKDMTDEELMALGYFMSNRDLNLFKETLEIYNKDVLNAICNKYSSYDMKDTALEVTDYLLDKRKLLPNKIKEFIDTTLEEDIRDINLERTTELEEFINKTFGV